jgi:hypothetical protein
VGSLPLVVVLLLGAHLAVLYSHRALLVEQRASAAQQRAVQAQEAAEAGLAWTLARLGAPGDSDACGPASGRSLRQRWLDSLASPAPMRPACLHDGDRWRCDCPDAGTGHPIRPDPQRHAPSFGITLQAAGRPGQDLIEVTVEGCTDPGTGCGGEGEPDARYRVTTTLAPIGHLMQRPQVALTSSGDVTLGAGTLVVNGDIASGGIVVQAAGTVTLRDDARTVGPPGQPASAGIVASDTQVAGGADGLWRRLAGLPLATVQTLPGWHRLRCAGVCGSADLQARFALGDRAFWIDGDLTLADATLGERTDPLLVVVRGRFSPGRALTLHGVIVADDVSGTLAAGDATSDLRGALLGAGAVALQGPIRVTHVPDTVARAATLGAARAPVPGSWFDPHTR